MQSPREARLAANGLHAGMPFFVVRIRRRFGLRDAVYIATLAVRAVSRDGKRIASASQRSKAPAYCYEARSDEDSAAISVLRPDLDALPIAFTSASLAAAAVRRGIAADLYARLAPTNLQRRAMEFETDISGYEFLA